LRHPAVVKGAPRSDVNTNGDGGSWSRLSRRSARSSTPPNGWTDGEPFLARLTWICPGRSRWYSRARTSALRTRLGGRLCGLTVQVTNWWTDEIAGYLKDFYEDPVAGERPKLAVPKPLFVEAELDEHSDCFRSCHPFLDRPFIYSRAQLVGQSDGSHRITPRGRSASTTLLFWYDLY
jgi:hypothetical protein